MEFVPSEEIAIGSEHALKLTRVRRVLQYTPLIVFSSVLVSHTNTSYTQQKAAHPNSLAMQTSGSFTVNERQILTSVNTAASTLSMLGSAFIVLCYVLFKELRKFSFKLVFFLALSVSSPSKPDLNPMFYLIHPRTLIPTDPFLLLFYFSLYN